MYLTYRNTQLSDLEVCYPFLQARLCYSSETQKHLMKLSRKMTETGSWISMVYEDIDRPEGKRQVAFLETFFAQDWFLKEAKTNFPPFLPLNILEKWKKGFRFILSPKEQSKAQTQEGLNTVLLHWGVDPEYGQEDYLKIIEYVSQTYVKILARYHLKEYLEEVYGEFERDRLMTFGCQILRDYRENFEARCFKETLGKGHPYLMSVVLPELRDERKKLETLAGSWALLGPPRFAFKPNEQEVLKKALDGETDEEIARALGLSLDAIKKRWQGIYAKVEAVDTHFFSGPDGAENGGKGKQKRRALLKILREHPEELWPNTT